MVASARLNPPTPRGLWLLLPAYEEAANLEPLLRDVAAVAAAWGEGAALRVLVVDDGSADNTAEVARAAHGVPVDVVVHAVNQGLGAAMRTGIETVLARGGPGDVLFTMDADHSHPPESMPAMLRALDEGAGLVIASRFQPGASVHGLVWYRRWISVVASWILRGVFPGARDYTCGYRAYPLSLLRWGASRYGAAFLNQSGFSVMVDLLLKLRHRARPIAEVPLTLRYDRKQGPSKMKLLRTTWTTLCLLRRRLVGDPTGP